MKMRPRVRRSAWLLIVLSISLLAFGTVKVSASEAAEEELKQTAAFILSQCIHTEEGQLELLQEQREADLDFLLLQNGIPCGGKDYLSILKAWREGEEECGAYDTGQDIARLLDSFTVKKRNNELQLTGEVRFENRSADLTFTFEKDGTITALTVGGHYEIGEVMKKAIQNTAIGMGVVFVVLVFMSAIISCLRFVGMLQGNKSEGENGGKEPAKRSEAGQQAEQELDDEILCIIAAAVSRDLRDYPLRKKEESPYGHKVNWHEVSRESGLGRTCMSKRQDKKEESPYGHTYMSKRQDKKEENMRKYNITVNGKTYGVEVEEADATLVGSRPIRPASVSAQVQAATAESKAQASPASPAVPKTEASPAPKAESKAQASPASKASGGGAGEIKAGITGKVLSMQVSAGQAVKGGDTVMVLEAMKMEIPIVCPKDGTIAKLLVKEGDPVESGQVLATLS